MADASIFDQYPLDQWKDPDHRIMDRFSLKGRKGFVTGGAGGLGRNVAAAWAEAGADVAIVDLPRTRETLEPLAKELSERYGVNVVPLYCDVSDREQVDALKTSLVEALGTVDVAFINAGVNVPGDDADEPYEVWQKTIDINLTGAYLTAQIAQRIMREHGHGGSLVFTSSLSAHNANFIAGGPSPVAAYGASKAGIYEYARYLAAALAPYGIRSNAISPGYVWSGIFEGRIVPEAHDMMTAPLPMRRFGTNEEIASAVLFLASDASSYVTGTNLQVDGGYSVY
ncbi:SDR family oxidoreductase [Bifidobacterium avesanii]|uniref:SDR family oxidoreductase n=1 Tax=Bifidobacterium avesanii TaxID=1798157 RepID=A0A7K3THW4_9BIFI|nr:SDR family oxidoreductase [Bifidobacterium avesanii]KAB8293645.1 sorbose reductase SOU1 (Sorbitol utilization proteinSOU1) [Bifidobacterium avesanii]NEG78220.1 SDR family oxidoreductase [Bifidobacterium avesanii]